LNQNQRQMPRHVAIIMDGNGRWAEAHGLERTDGHSEGARAVRDTVETAARMGIQYLTLYAFSMANWSRPRSEIDKLMHLLLDFSRRERMELRELGIRVRVAGHAEELPLLTRLGLRELIDFTSCGERMTLTLALSYGGRRDMIDAVRALAEQARAGQLDPSAIDESVFRGQMTTRELPDVDLLIRTGGESRVSDFLLFEAAYAELLFLSVMWPEFRPRHLVEAVEQFMRLERRFGLTSEQVRTASFERARANGQAVLPLSGHA
jgi:undecaprenyl diphosphate synthase